MKKCPNCKCNLDTWEEFQKETQLARKLVKIEKDRLKAIKKRSNYVKKENNTKNNRIINQKKELCI